MVANGPNLPTTAQGDCGTILVVNDARKGADARGGRVLGLGLVVAAMGINGVVGGWWVWRARAV